MESAICPISNVKITFYSLEFGFGHYLWALIIRMGSGQIKAIKTKRNAEREINNGSDLN